MSWRDIVRKSGCTAKMGNCSCEECLNKGGCPHCDGNAPRSKCICGSMRKKYKDDFRFREKESPLRRGQDQPDELSKTGSKPDYIDIDGDGNKTESMKEAAKDKKNKPESKNPFTRKD